MRSKYAQKKPNLNESGGYDELEKTESEDGKED
jgi:hypothetical protein